MLQIGVLKGSVIHLQGVCDTCVFVLPQIFFVFSDFSICANGLSSA